MYVYARRKRTRQPLIARARESQVTWYYVPLASAWSSILAYARTCLLSLQPSPQTKVRRRICAAPSPALWRVHPFSPAMPHACASDNDASYSEAMPSRAVAHPQCPGEDDARREGGSEKCDTPPSSGEVEGGITTNPNTQARVLSVRIAQRACCGKALSLGPRRKSPR